MLNWHFWTPYRVCSLPASQSFCELVVVPCLPISQNNQSTVDQKYWNTKILTYHQITWNLFKLVSWWEQLFLWYGNNETWDCMCKKFTPILSSKQERTHVTQFASISAQSFLVYMVAHATVVLVESLQQLHCPSGPEGVKHNTSNW